MDGKEIEVYSEDFVWGRGREKEREERVLARTRQSQRKSRDSRPSEYIRRRTVEESVGLGLKCGKLGVSVYVCASERGRERGEAIRWYSLFLCIHLSQARADIFSSPDRFDQHSTLSPPLLLLSLLLSILAVSPICSP